MPAHMIWPWWVRLSHWLVAIGVIVLWVLTYFYYETDNIHRWLGYTVTSLVGIRVLAAGFTSAPAARLSFASRQQVAHHIIQLKQRRLPATDGHNPLGQLAVYIIWALIILLALTGWLSRTDLFWGEDWPVEIHAWLSGLLMGVVALHILAVFVVGRISRQHLILQMLHGKRHLYRKSADGQN